MSSNTTFRIVNAFCFFLILLFEELKTGGMTTVKKIKEISLEDVIILLYCDKTFILNFDVEYYIVHITV